jgi:hypothetical protein
MIWLALISIVACGSSGPVAETTESAKRAATARSPVNVPSSLALVVAAAPDISNGIVSGALSEAAVIWKAAGLTLQWRVSNDSSRAIEPSMVQVILDDARGTASEGELPIGWIAFDPSGVPAPLLHLSRLNADQLLNTSAAYRNRPDSYKELLTARALGRALAHELGHYLTASKDHTPSGLMKGRRFVDEFFSPARSGFQMDDRGRWLAARGLALTAANREARAGTPETSAGIGRGGAPQDCVTRDDDRDCPPVQPGGMVQPGAME